MSVNISYTKHYDSTITLPLVQYLTCIWPNYCTYSYKCCQAISFFSDYSLSHLNTSNINIAHTNAWESKFDLAVKGSNFNIGPSFYQFDRSPVPHNLCKDYGPGLIWFWRRRFLKVFTIYGHGSHFDQYTKPILAIFHSPAPWRLHMKFEQHWPRGFRGEVIWNHQHFFHTNVWDPYKCIQKQTWPCREKVKCQCTTIILATLVDLPSLGWFLQRFSHKVSSVLEK